MTTQCPHCGTMLPRDDARFCNHCGNAISSPVSLAQSSSGAASSNTSSPQEASSTVHQPERKPKLREQIAQQPLSRSPKPSAQPEPPLQIEELESSDPKRSLPSISSDQEPLSEKHESAESMSEGTDQAQPSSEKEQSSIDAQQPAFVHENASPGPIEQQTSPTNGTPSRAQFAGRELRVKVWEQEDTALLPAEEDASDVVEDQPTRPLASSSAMSGLKDDLQNAAARPVPMPAEPAREQIEQLDTVQIAAYGQAKPISADSPPITDQVDLAEKATQISESVAQRPVPQPLSMPGITPLPAQREASMPGITPLPGGQQRGMSMPGVTPVPGGQQRGTSLSGISMQERRPDVQQAVIPVTPPPQRMGRRPPLIAVLVLLPVLLFGALAIWIIQTQPFSVSPVSQPWQKFQDEKLGVAFSYPNGWQVQVDDAKSTVRLADSTNTAQVNVAASNAPGGDLAQYLSQQAKQMQMADAKSATSVSFAHASWTQVQGTTQQRGANYTTTLLATVHNNRLFTITLLAPSSNYADQEKMNFSYMRNSWQFL